MNIIPETGLEEDQLFSWHANVLTVNRKKTIVLVNDKSRYVIVLYGLKKKDFKQLDTLLLQGIQETLEQEGIKEEVIQQYISHSPRISYAKTKDRTCVARMNKACETLTFLADRLINDQLINTDMGKRISRLMVGNGKNDYIYPNKEMYKELELFAGNPIFSTMAVQLLVTLKLQNHKVWRRIVVPANRTFNNLHEIIQEAFGWRDCHLYEFMVLNQEHKPRLKIVADEEAFFYPGEVEMKMDRDVRISDIIFESKEIHYTYDFGDNWEHRIEVEGLIEDYPANHPVADVGEGTTPPEDVGGEPGYEEYLKIIGDPNHPDHLQMKRWGLTSGNTVFDRNRVNRLLARK